MKKIIFILLAFLCFPFTNAFADDAIIKFATEASYPPFESKLPDGKIDGFDVAIMNALCAQMKKTCTITNQPWDSLIPSLQLGKFDALIAAMAITDERKKQVDFTNSYYDAFVSFIAAKSANLDTSSAGMKGKTVGIQGGTTFGNYLKAMYGSDVTVNTYSSEEDALLDLSSGRVDAVLADTALAAQWVKQHGHGDYVLVGKPINDPKYFGIGNGIAVKKGNTDLVNALNKALAEIKANGTYQKIAQQYLSS